MANFLILNAHQPYAFSKGRLNASLVEVAEAYLTARKHEVQVVQTADDYSVDDQIELHLWADTLILQSPVNWMGLPWSAKRYCDEIYSAGMDGRLCRGDGRRSQAPKADYGSGGTLKGKSYMLSLTFNAPEEAFNAPEEYLFGGKSVDDLFFPQHMNFRFFGMKKLETFACYDVIKDPQIEEGLARFRKHLNSLF